MKKILFLFFLISISINAQYKITGEMVPSKKYNWVLLYKIEGARQIFIKNGNLKKSTKVINGKKTDVSRFEFTLPADAKVGAYRVTYSQEGKSFADFLFNKEDVDFIFNPEKAEETIRFKKSNENKLYQEYINIVSTEQYKTDSLQIAYLKNPANNINGLYQKQLTKIANLQKQYLAKSKGKMVYHFIKATNRYNRPTLAKNPQEYLKSINDHFFDTIDFNNPTLYNSAFIVDRITDFVFYMNYSDDPKKQRLLNEKTVAIVLSKAKDQTFKKDVIEFLITQFINAQNVDFADYMIANYYKKLPTTIQNKKFLSDYNENTKASIGRIAPEITWSANGKNYKLSTLNDKPYYVLVFWSTGCGHCLREIPVLYQNTQNSKNVKVVAFSLENNDKDWKNHIKKYPNWHNVIGLKKWENPIARTYQIFSTPTYIVLNKEKKIIAKPNTLEEVQKIVQYLDQ
jgi:thiol-disulfide isomerase/thioredoxin